MTVTVVFLGSLSGQTGQDRVVFTLPEGADYGLLLREFEKQVGRLFPARIWDAEGKTFKPGIRVLGDGRDFHRPETLLRDGEEIKIFPLLGGG